MENIEPGNQETREFYSIANESELGNGARLFVEIGAQPIVVLNIQGKIFAIADSCSHDDGPLGDGEVDDHVIKCPRHGASFDIITGKVLSLPAIVDIPTFPVKIVNGEIFVGIPKRE